MKKLFLALIGLTMSWVASAETYDVFGTYQAGDEYSGEVVFRIDDGKSASFSNEHVQSFIVAISKKSETQVLLNLDFKGGAYQSEAAVLLDLDQPAKFNFGEQIFTFTVRKHAS